MVEVVGTKLGTRATCVSIEQRLYLIMLSFTSRLMTSRIRQLGCHLVPATTTTRSATRTTSSHLSSLAYHHVLPTATTSLTPATPATPIFSGILSDYLASTAIWWIKRTFQPSVLRKKRQHGYLNRSKSVGGRKILRRRKAKGRARLFGA